MTPVTSVYLDLVRFLAALTVFFAHANYERFTGKLPFFWRIADRGNDAVMVFFVLSGFVIAHVAHSKERTVRDYAASRLARLYSVAIPALILTMILDPIGAMLAPDKYLPLASTDAPVWQLIANLFFVNEVWFNSVRPFSNAPYWSLGYEFWYYAIFAAVFYFRGWVRAGLVALACLIAGPKILLLWPVWLLGVATYHLAGRYRGQAALGIALIVCSLGAYALYRMYAVQAVALAWLESVFGEAAIEQYMGFSKFVLSSYVVGLIVALNFLGVAMVAHRLPSPGAVGTAIRYAAGFTFALYLFHYPLLQFFGAATAHMESADLRRLVVVIGTLLVVWGLGSITEARKGLLRRSIVLAIPRFSALRTSPPLE